jgi:RNA polymerase sigma-70 factor (ECF subfamily)
VQTDIHKDIIERSKKGDAKAQYDLYSRYAKAMFNTCYRMMNNVETAEDMLQESFSEAFRRLDSFRYESTFGAWLKRIVVNRCINEIKRKKVELSFVEDMSPFGNRADDPDDGTELTVEGIKKAMQQLPAGSRMIFSLYLLEGYDHREIAEILGVSESNSKSQYMRAKRKIKEILEGGNHETR